MLKLNPMFPLRGLSQLITALVEPRKLQLLLLVQTSQVGGPQ
jgi:hypothetical protein